MIKHQHLYLLQLALVVLVAACGAEDNNGLGELDPRCESLCADSDQECSEHVTECEGICQARIAEVSTLCATCLLESSHSGVCLPGTLCCPDPTFPSSVLDCVATCEGGTGVNPSGNHPVCVALCADDAPVCAADAEQCLQECQARISGVSGICATCLLEGAHGGVCVPGASCCPDPRFPTSATDRAAVCG